MAGCMSHIEDVKDLRTIFPVTNQNARPGEYLAVALLTAEGYNMLCLGIRGRGSCDWFKMIGQVLNVT